jgi:hypothetical protein
MSANNDNDVGFACDCRGDSVFAVISDGNVWRRQYTAANINTFSLLWTASQLLDFLTNDSFRSLFYFIELYSLLIELMRRCAEYQQI